MASSLSGYKPLRLNYRAEKKAKLKFLLFSFPLCETEGLDLQDQSGAARNYLSVIGSCSWCAVVQQIKNDSPKR